MPAAGFLRMSDARAQVSGLEAAVQATGRADLAGQLAGCYAMLGRQAEALRLYEASWERQRSVEVAVNLTTTLRDLGRHDESAAYSELAYWQTPEDPYVRLLHGETLLRAGHWRAGWPLYDTGRPTKLGERLRQGLPGHCREWSGEPLGERDFLYVLMEGGAGDRISYARWLMKLGGRGVRHWRVFAYEPQAGLFLRWLPRERVALEGDTIPQMTDPEWTPWWTTVFSLPANFAAGPNDVPPWFDIGHGYDNRLRASPEAIEKFKVNRPADELPIVGLCWEAAELSPADDPEPRKVRSLTEAQAMRLVCQTADRVHWVSMQHGRTLAWPMTRIPFDTWEDSAGLLENLDALLTVDTGTLHLAGALCRPLGILLSTNSDWKFLAKGRCPFYRTAQLYRNGEGGGFENAINQAVAAIRERGLGAFG